MRVVYFDILFTDEAVQKHNILNIPDVHRAFV